MSTLLFAVALIGVLWLVVFVLSRLRGEGTARRFELAALLFLCAALGAGWYIIYVADDGAAIVLRGMEIGGFVGDLFELALAAGMLWSVGYFWWSIRSTPGAVGCVAVLAALAWTAFAVPASLLIAIRGIVSLFA